MFRLAARRGVEQQALGKEKSLSTAPCNQRCKSSVHCWRWPRRAAQYMAPGMGGAEGAVSAAKAASRSVCRLMYLLTTSRIQLLRFIGTQREGVGGYVGGIGHRSTSGWATRIVQGKGSAPRQLCSSSFRVSAGQAPSPEQHAGKVRHDCVGAGLQGQREMARRVHLVCHSCPVAV